MKITIADATGRVIRNARRHEDRRHQPRDVEPRAEAAAGPPAGGFGGGGRGGAPPAVDAGTYIVTLSVGGKTYTKPVSVLQDRWLGRALVAAFSL